MTLLESKIHAFPDVYRNEWLADAVSEITPGFDPGSCPGSTILCIEGGCIYIKNCEGKWQKFGTSEVI